MGLAFPKYLIPEILVVGNQNPVFGKGFFYDNIIVDASRRIID